MAFIGYYEFSLLGVTRLGIFSPGVAENTYSVQIFESTVQELQPLGEEHLRYLPMVFLDRRIVYVLSYCETIEKREVYIVNRRHFALEGGCKLIFREGQADIYGISQQWFHGDVACTHINDDEFPPNQFSTFGRFSNYNFRDNLFFKYCQRESIAAAFQKALRASKGARKINFTVANIRPDVWEEIISYLDGADVFKKSGTRTQDIASDEVVCKIAGSKDLRMVHVDDVTLLQDYLGKCYSHFPICDTADLPTINLVGCHYTSLECFNLFYDINCCELRVANVGPITESTQDQATLIMEQRSIDIEFWKQKLEEKWFFNIESKTWVYVILVDFVRKALRRIGTRFTLVFVSAREKYVCTNVFSH